MAFGFDRYITPGHWQMIVRCIREHYNEYDGFIITHGTDTLAYTAAALSYMIQGSPKPIILTGAKLNKLENCFVIVISFHEQKYPLTYYFK